MGNNNNNNKLVLINFNHICAMNGIVTTLRGSLKCHHLSRVCVYPTKFSLLGKESVKIIWDTDFQSYPPRAPYIMYLCTLLLKISYTYTYVYRYNVLVCVCIQFFCVRTHSPSDIGNISNVGYEIRKYEIRFVKFDYLKYLFHSFSII